MAAWAPWAEQDIEVLEGVQKRLIRQLSDKRGSSYEENCKNAGLTTLRERRERGDMIETFKSVKGHNRVNKEEWFTFRDVSETRNTRANSTVTSEGATRREDVMFMENHRLEIRKHCFNVRVIRRWNALPDAVKAVKFVNASKNAYDNWMKQNQTL